MKDLERMKDVLVVSYPVDQACFLMRFLFAFHNSERINNYVNLPFKDIWFSKYFKMRHTVDKPLCFVMMEPKISVDYFAYLRKKYSGCKIVAVYRDFLKVYYTRNPQWKKENIFDLQFSYDRAEAEKERMCFFDEFESKINIKQSESYPKCDVFFAGKAKDRLETILKVCKKLTDTGYNCNFFITHADENEKKKMPGVVYLDHDFSYYEMLSRSINAKCLLDINQKGAVGYTSRFLEAVMYNKKLITNNRAILESKFYKSDRIMLIDSVDDLDPTFIDDSPVDYNYNNEFSPIHLINSIDNELERRLDLK